MQRLKARIAAATIVAGLASVALPAAADYHSINGQVRPMTSSSTRRRTAAGRRLLAGRPGLLGRDGQCSALGNIYSGAVVLWQRRAGLNGWSHYDNMSGTWVGGDNNGCYYSGDWSIADAGAMAA
jgi:hypothetical protein